MKATIELNHAINFYFYANHLNLLCRSQEAPGAYGCPWEHGNWHSQNQEIIATPIK